MRIDRTDWTSGRGGAKREADQGMQRRDLLEQGPARGRCVAVYFRPGPSMQSGGGRGGRVPCAGLLGAVGRLRMKQAPVQGAVGLR